MLSWLATPSPWRNAAVRPAIGIDIGSRTVKAVQVRRDKQGKVEIAAALERPRQTPGAWTADEAAALVAALGCAGFTGKKVTCAIATADTLVGPLELPPRSSNAPLDQLARTELARSFRRQPDSFEMAWWELPHAVRTARGITALGIAVPHDKADERIDAFETGGCTVDAVDVEACALARACASSCGPTGVTAILDLAWSAATLTCIHGGAMIFSRRLPECGVGPLHDSLCKKLSTEPEVAEFLLGEIGLSEKPLATSTQAGDAASQQFPVGLPDEGRRVILGFADMLAKEMNLSFGYAASQSNDAVESLLLCGGGACVAGLAAKVGSLLDVPSRAQTPAELATCDASALNACSSPTMMGAFGLALRVAA